jgi:ATP-binding cassette subfamily B protein
MGFHGGNWFSFIRYDEEQDRPDISWNLLKRVSAYARPYSMWVLIMLGTILGISVLSVIPPLLTRELIDVAIPEKNTTMITLLALGMVAVPLLSGLLGVAQRFANSNVGEGLIFDLRRQLYAHLQRMSMSFFTNTHSGELISRLNNDVIGAQRAMTSTLVTIVSDTVALIATLIIMFAMDWRLTLLSVAILPLFILPARRVGRTLRRIARESMDLNAAMNALMNETLNISGAVLVKLFGRYYYEVERFAKRAVKVRDIGVRQAVIGRWFFLGLSLVSAVGTALVFWLGGILVVQGAFTIGTLVAFTAYLTRLYGPLMALTNARVDLATSLVSFERVFEVLDLPLEITDRPESIQLIEAEGHVRYENVSFQYASAEKKQVGLEDVRRFSFHSSQAYVPPSKKADGERDHDQVDQGPRWAVRGVSFSIQPGQIAALVGPSGAGKTSITYLLPRLYDPTEGRVTLDGYDLRHISLESLSTHIGMVTQETYLFHDTIRQNLLYAKTEATETEMMDACKTANIHNFIAGLPDGYDTIVGERGYRLSGGEKQRVAIARVLLKDPKILVLDEATSHLDSQSELLIREAMEKVMRGRTSLVIAHRLSTVIHADQILVMDGGILVEQGTHSELLAKGQLYSQLYETQFMLEEGEPRKQALET